ncbi:hypothetical protein [Pyramidobacter sp. CG50-2]|uniref:hypothetical protein n=1 Tax=Pyramidobacter sp. CG50-2 TaxID=2382160 RepID=UPI0013152F56|nr:hypothetical protein [Pyramidobacter sp. CG50-2]
MNDMFSVSFFLKQLSAYFSIFREFRQIPSAVRAAAKYGALDRRGVAAFRRNRPGAAV